MTVNHNSDHHSNNPIHKGLNVIRMGRGCDHSVDQIIWVHGVVHIGCGHGVVHMGCGPGVVHMGCGHGVVHMGCGHGVIQMSWSQLCGVEVDRGHFSMKCVLRHERAHEGAVALRHAHCSHSSRDHLNMVLHHTQPLKLLQ